MNKGDTVKFQGKLYIILHIYDSKYCEIKEINHHQVELVKLSDLEW
jgi:hypothetical protein